MQEAMQSSASSLKKCNTSACDLWTTETHSEWKNELRKAEGWKKWRENLRKEFQMIYGFDRRAAEYYVALRQSRWCVFIASRWIRVDKMTTNANCKKLTVLLCNLPVYVFSNVWRVDLFAIIFMLLVCCLLLRALWDLEDHLGQLDHL